MFLTSSLRGTKVRSTASMPDCDIDYRCSLISNKPTLISRQITGRYSGKLGLDQNSYPDQTSSSAVCPAGQHRTAIIVSLRNQSVEITTTWVFSVRKRIIHASYSTGRYKAHVSGPSCLKTRATDWIPTLTGDKSSGDWGAMGSHSG